MHFDIFMVMKLVNLRQVPGKTLKGPAVMKDKHP